ncbi:MAG: HNH/ENDO VII family nuclease [Actinomycetia bacterium]|nr:HNH/ENDO VII family nuclease [Actinomycetes bacterium]
MFSTASSAPTDFNTALGGTYGGTEHSSVLGSIGGWFESIWNSQFTLDRLPRGCGPMICFGAPHSVTVGHTVEDVGIGIAVVGGAVACALGWEVCVGAALDSIPGAEGVSGGAGALGAGAIGLASEIERALEEEGVPASRHAESQVLDDLLSGHGIGDTPDVAARRVTLRKGTREAILDAQRAPDGKIYDPNTGVEIPEGQGHFGHRPGYEWWRTQLTARMEGWTRQQVIEYENIPSHYWYEDPSSNMSHRYELPR